MGGPRWPIVLAAAVTLAGCSGDGDASPTITTTTVPESTTTAAPTTTETPTTTTTVPESTTTAAPTPTAATVPEETTTSSSTTLPDGVPPRVSFPDDPELQVVVDGAYAFFDRLRAVSLEPDDEAARAALSAVMEDPIASRVVQFLDELVSNGERVVANPEQATFIEVFAFTVQVVGDSATFDACAVDADIRVAVGQGPDGSDLVVDDSINSAAQTYQLVRIDSEWRVREIERFARFEGAVGCD